MRITFLKQLIVAIGLLTAPSAIAQPKCVHPDVDSFLEQSRNAIGYDGTYYPDPSAIFLTFQRDGNYFQWMGASWWGPVDGALFVLNCKGSRVAALNLGQFQQLKAGPTISGFGKTLEVVYILSQGTGYQAEDVNLIAFLGKSIVVLWDNEASEMFSDPAAEPPVDYTDQYTWRYSKSGKIIEVTARRIVGDFKDTDHGWAPHTLHDLPSEEFCWNEAQLHYTACKVQE